jgi:hypothetical protein
MPAAADSVIWLKSDFAPDTPLNNPPPTPMYGRTRIGRI